jgi:hypothetical protein
MLTEKLDAMNPNEYSERYWLREIAIQLADINGNLYGIRQQGGQIGDLFAELVLTILDVVENGLEEQAAPEEQAVPEETTAK